MQTRFFDRFETLDIRAPFTNRCISPNGSAVGAEKQFSNAIHFVAWLETRQAKPRPIEIPRIKALDESNILRPHRLGKRFQIRNDVLPGVEELPPFALEVVHPHRGAEVERYR